MLSFVAKLENPTFFLGSLANKLTGKEKTQFTPCLMKYWNIEQFLNDLDESCKSEINADTLQLSLKNV